MFTNKSGTETQRQPEPQKHSKYSLATAMLAHQQVPGFSLKLYDYADEFLDANAITYTQFILFFNVIFMTLNGKK